MPNEKDELIAEMLAALKAIVTKCHYKSVHDMVGHALREELINAAIAIRKAEGR